MVVNKLLFDGTEFLKQQNIPRVFPDKILLSPGTWNDSNYTDEEIKKAFELTDWNNKSNFSLYLDHKDVQEAGVGNWVGYVRNLNLNEKGKLIGDLEVWNPSLIVYLDQAKAKFGVSATLRGMEDGKTKSMKNFRFESFSVVTNPACKEAFINLSQKEDVEVENADISNFESIRKKKGMSVSEFYAVPKDTPSDSKLPIFDAAHVRNALARFNQTQFTSESEKKTAMAKIKRAAKKFGIKVSDKSLQSITNERRIKIVNMNEEEQTQEEQPTVEEPVEESVEEPTEEVTEAPVEEETKEEPVEEVKEESLSEKEIMSVVTNSEWSKFSTSYKAKNKEATLSEMVKAFQSKDKESKEINELSDSDIVGKIEMYSSILRERQKSLKERMSPAAQVKQLSEEVKLLRNKLREPERKTLSQSRPKASNIVTNEDPLSNMAEFLMKGGQGSFDMA